MSEYPHQDAPRLPDRDGSDFGGSLADHVRQYATEDPVLAAERDRLATLADHHAATSPPAGSAAQMNAQHVDNTPAVLESEGREVWDELPPDATRVLCKGDGIATNAGGLWTVRYPDGNSQQFGHTFFAISQGPFRPAPTEYPPR
jgi:hypothetical protein